MQFLANNTITTVEQPQNAIINTQPIELGNYTYNNHVYASMEETKIFTTDKLLGIVAGDSDRVINYEISLTPNSDTLLVNTPTVTLYVLSNISSLTTECNTFTVTYTINNVSHNITVNKPTYIECIADMINQINTNEHTNMSYEQITLDNESNRDIVKIYTPVDIQLSLPSELMYSNGFIAYIKDLEETGTTLITLPINDIYTGQSLVNWCTLNDQNGVLAISVSTPCDISVLETTTIIR